MEKSNNKTVKAVQEMQKSNVEELNQINNEISTSMTNIKRNLNETVKKAEQETRDLVSNAKHGALVTNIIDALKYGAATRDRKSTRLNSSHVAISYAVFCLKKK